MDLSHWKLYNLKYLFCIQKQIYNLSRQLEDAQKAIEEGNALEPVLRKTIEELEDDKTDLMV